MWYRLSCVLCSLWLLLSGDAVGDAQEPDSPPPDPVVLLRQVRDHYRSASSYRAEGKALTRILQPESGVETTVGIEFRMWLGRPDLYRIEWTRHGDPERPESGAVWNDGNGPHLFLSAPGRYARMKSDAIALAAATGESMGVAHTIPGLFFDLRNEGGLLDHPESPVLEGSEPVDGVPCHVVAASLPSGVEYRLWISKAGPVLIQVENLLGGASQAHAVPEVTVEQEETALRAAGLEVTEANRARVRAALQQARDRMKKVRGTIKQLHQGIRLSVPLPTETFAFEPPEGAAEGLDIAGAEL